MKFFQDCAKLMKKPVNQVGEPRHPPRKTRPAQEPFHQTEFVKDQSRPLKVTTEMPHRADGNGDDFRVGHFDANIFAVSARLEKIINKTVYCKSAIAHIKSSPLVFVWSQNFRRRLFLFQYQNLTGNLGYLSLFWADYFRFCLFSEYQFSEIDQRKFLISN